MTALRRCEVVPLEQVYELSFQLSQAVRGAGYLPDLVVAIARGGFVPARLVCDFLQCRHLTSIGIRHYAPGARRDAIARVVDPLRIDLQGRRVLVVDDVNDTGDTLEAARLHLQERGPAELRMGVLHEKEHSRVRADHRAADASSDRWLVYQWAVVEDAVGFLEQMDPVPESPSERRRRLETELGMELTDAVWRKVLAVLRPPTPTEHG